MRSIKARGRAVAGLLALALAAGAAAGCTTRYRVPESTQPCIDACDAANTRCLARCAEPRGQIQVLEDVRAGLCEQRCGEEHDDCRAACPGLQQQ